MVKKRVNCPECNQEMSLAGLPWHRLAKHNVRPNKSNSTIGNSTFAQANTQANALSETIQVVQKAAEKPQEVKTTMEQEIKEHNPQDCPECRRREFKIVDLEHELDNLHKTNTALEQKLSSNEDRAYEIPDLGTVIQHCESGECASHAKQWDGIKARIVQGAYDNLPPEAVPDKVVESEGLRRGFIPKKIILPGRLVRDD